MYYALGPISSEAVSQALNLKDTNTLNTGVLATIVTNSPQYQKVWVSRYEKYQRRNYCGRG